MKKIVQSIGTFFKNEALDIEKDFINLGKAIGAFLKKEETNLTPLMQAALADLAVLEKQAISTARDAAIAAVKTFLTDVIAAL